MVSRSLKSRVANWLLDDVETKAAPVSNLSSPESWLAEYLGAWPSASGISVGPATAIRVPAVLACVRLISTSVGGLPAKVLKLREDGSKEPDREHPAHRLVHRLANPWTSAGELRRQLTVDSLLHGHGIAVAVRDGSDGRVLEFIRVDPACTSITVEANAYTGEPVYFIGANRQRYDFRDVLHIANPAGAAIVALAKEAIGVAATLEHHAATLFKDGARPASLLIPDKPLQPSAIANIKAAWRAMIGEGAPAVLDAGFKYEQITLASTDAQFLENRQYQLGEIVRAFGVPPTFIGILDQASYRNAEELNTQFATFGLKPWIDVWEAAYERVLLSEDELDEYNIEFNIEGLLRADSATRARFYADLRASGAITANEVRARENLPAREDGNVLGNPYTTSNTAPTPVASEKEAA